MEITYFYNSGFAVKIGETLLVFDYYVDSEKKLPELISRAQQVYFFASHWHGDHFSHLGLFLGGAGQNDAALGGLFSFHQLDDHAILQRIQFHIRKPLFLGILALCRTEC